MDFKEYQESAAKTAGAYGEGPDRVLGAGVGMSCETGELLNEIKKFYWHKHLLDTRRMAEELGDVLWYLSELCMALDIELEDVARLNLEKLAIRYPNGFNVEDSRNR